MKQFFNVVVENYFSLFVGSIALAIILLGMQISVNFGSFISQGTIFTGWMIVFITMTFITTLCLIQLNKSSENKE